MFHILYIDDEEFLLDIGKTYLEKDGEFLVDTTTSVKEALSLLSKVSYDGIVSDYMMPDIDGIDFLKLVRKEDKTITFIFFTGRGDESVASAAINNGADFYLKKDPEGLTTLFQLGQLLKQGISKKTLMRLRLKPDQ